jgi:uncharacterized protein (DUF1786 family)
MRILAVDVGTGTQDILLFDTDKDVENCFKLVMPSPTVLVARTIRRATAEGRDVLLTGSIMGGGPCAWAADDHLRAGLKVYATPLAAQTFDDDLSRVEVMGVRLVDPADAAQLSGGGFKPTPGLVRIEMKDFYLDAIREAMAAFGLDLEFDALALAVFDHGAAPPGYSDRRFRFDYLEEQIGKGAGLTGFAFWRDEIPARFTRLQSLADSAPADRPVLIMDTAPAAVIGALEDPRVREHDNAVVANIGNFHCLAFHLTGGEIVAVFEHHTGELTRDELVAYLRRLAEGRITNAEVFADMGHGALVLDPSVPPPDFFAVVGPRRGLMRGADLPLYQAVPHGDMMLAGCFGLLRAYAQRDPVHGAEIAAVLDGTVQAKAPW